MQHTVEELIIDTILNKEPSLSDMARVLKSAFPADPEAAYRVLVDFIMNMHYIVMNGDMRLSINESKKSEVLLKYYNTNSDSILPDSNSKNTGNNDWLGIICERDIWSTSFILSERCRFSLANMDFLPKSS
jgi:hypothetical protein